MKKVMIPILIGVLFLPAGICGAGTLRIDVHEVPVRAVLEGLARGNDLNLVIDDSVSGNVTIRLHDVTAEDALNALVAAGNLLVEEQDGIRLISGAGKNGAAKSTCTRNLHYAKAKEVAGILTSQLSSGQAEAYADGNTLIFGGTRRDLAEAKKIIDAVDIPGQQVDVEAEILSLSKDAVKELGIDWSWSGVEGGVGRTHLPYAEAQIRAFLSDGKASVLARPHIVTRNGKEARIFIGDKIPVVTEHLSGGEKTATTEYREAGIVLQYTPYIHPDGTVTADIHGEVSMPVYVRDLKAYSIATRQVDTEVCVKAGERIVIGGLVGKEVVESFHKVPLLGDIPLLGKLFQSHYHSKKETEVVIMIKSTLLPPPAVQVTP